MEINCDIKTLIDIKIQTTGFCGQFPVTLNLTKKSSGGKRISQINMTVLARREIIIPEQSKLKIYMCIHTHLL